MNTYSLRRYRKYLLPVAGMLLLTWLAALGCGVHMGSAWKGFGTSIGYFSGLLTPDWSAFADLWRPALDSIFISIVGTFAGAVISLFFGLAAASNIAPPWLRQITRSLLSLERALPEIVIVLFLVAAFGMGPFSGVLALVFGSVGMLGKLFADAIEELDKGSLEAIQAVGANRLQVMVYGVWHQIVPMVVSYTLFRFEWSIRLSVVLGAVGAGGIGLELYRSFSILDYHRCCSALILVLAMIILTERGSEYLRKKMNVGGPLK